MKYLIILFVLFSVNSKAQTDTMRMNIRLTMKQKHAALAANYFSPITDSRFKDSLKLAVGSGNNPDSIIQFLWPVKRLINFHTRLSAENTGGASTFYREFMDATVVTFGFGGIRSQLENRAAQTAQPAKGIAIFLLRNIQQWEAVQLAVLLERIKNGKTLVDIDETDY